MTIMFAVAAMRCKKLSIIWVMILSAVSSIAISKDAALRRNTCPVNLNRKFTGFTHSDKETGFLAESANHNQVFKGKTRFLANHASALKETAG